MEESKDRKYDLEERTLKFATRTREFARCLPRTISNDVDGRQVIRSSGSVGANYIEANESLSKKDCIYRIKICRKEAKESIYWFKLLDTKHINHLEEERVNLIQEATELMKIFGKIYRILLDKEEANN